MRWFVVFLVVANLVLYFWVKQQSMPSPGATMLAPPDIGRLRLLSELQEQGGQPESEIPADSPASTVPDSGASEEGSAESVSNADKAVAPPVSPLEDPIVGLASSDSRETAIPSPQIVADQESRGHVGVREMSDDAAVDQGPSIPEGKSVVLPDEVSPGAGGLVEITDSVSAESHPVAVPATCARVGPLTSREADVLIAHLPENLTLYSDIVEEYTKADAYYVMIPALPSREEGNRKMQELADAGVKDTWLFRSGEYRNAISLGLFTREASATRHAERIAKKGFPNKVIARTSQEEGRWLYLRNRDGEDIGPSLPLPDGASAEPLACP